MPAHDSAAPFRLKARWGEAPAEPEAAAAHQSLIRRMPPRLGRSPVSRRAAGVASRACVHALWQSYSCSALSLLSAGAQSSSDSPRLRRPAQAHQRPLRQSVVVSFAVTNAFRVLMVIHDVVPCGCSVATFPREAVDASARCAGAPASPRTCVARPVPSEDRCAAFR